MSHSWKCQRLSDPDFTKGTPWSQPSPIPLVTLPLHPHRHSGLESRLPLVSKAFPCFQVLCALRISCWSSPILSACLKQEGHPSSIQSAVLTASHGSRADACSLAGPQQRRPCLPGAMVSRGVLASCASLSLTAVLGERHSYPGLIDKGLRIHISFLLQRQRLVWASFHTEASGTPGFQYDQQQPDAARIQNWGRGQRREVWGREAERRATPPPGPSACLRHGLGRARVPTGGRAAKNRPRLPETPVQDQHL